MLLQAEQDALPRSDVLASDLAAGLCLCAATCGHPAVRPGPAQFAVAISGCICRAGQFPPMLAESASSAGRDTRQDGHGTTVDAHAAAAARADPRCGAGDIQAQGLAGLSAREIARRIEYSPGTIYNMFQNLDDVVLHVEARVLDALDERLVGVLRGDGDADRTRQRLAQAYLAFTQKSRASGTCCSSTTCRPTSSCRPGTSKSSKA